MPKKGKGQKISTRKERKSAKKRRENSRRKFFKLILNFAQTPGI